jgi:NodT family efflux transporter outer membrane factor (OMF) lipoprotein
MTVGPDFEEPTVELSPAWVEADERFRVSGEELVEWWRVLDDPVLDRLVEMARESNNDIKIAGLRVLEAQAQLGVAIGGKYPQQQVLAADASRIQASESNANTVAGDLDFEQYNLGLSVAWELDFWGKFRRAIEAADASLMATVAGYDETMVIVTALVADAYVIIRSTEEQLRIARENVALQRRSYEIVEVLYRHGDVAELDALQARTLLLSTEATIPTLETSLRQARHALATLLGGSSPELDELLATPGELPDVPEDIAVGIPADLLRQRPDVRQAEMQAMAQNALVGVAQADLYPSFTLRGSIGVAAAGGTETTRTGESGVGELFNADSLTYSVGPSFTWPFLNYGRIRNNIRVQDARLQQALVSFAETVNQAVRDVEDALAAFVGSRAEDEVLAQAVDTAIRSSDLAMLRYREGFADYQRVLDAQQALFGQQQRYAANRGEAVRSLVSLYRALGGGWQTRPEEGFVDAETRQTMTERTNWGDLLKADEAPELPDRTETTPGDSGPGDASSGDPDPGGNAPMEQA